MSAHHDEQQDIENAKHLWHKGGKWLFALLVAAALGYLGKVIYDGHIESQNLEAATQAAQIGGDSGKLAALQQQYPDTAAAAQASLKIAAQHFNAGRYDEAAAAYRWVLDHHRAPLLQAVAAQNLAAVYLQQKKYDDALKAAEIAVDPAFQPVLSESKGDILVAQGKAAEAKAAYQAALDKLPENAAARELLETKINAL